MKKRLMHLGISVLFLCTIAVLPAFADITGPHNGEFPGYQFEHIKGVCSGCHIPHKSIGNKIWGKSWTTSKAFGGIRQLCYSCHDGTAAQSGIDSVFGTEGEIKWETHVMHGAADTQTYDPDWLTFGDSEKDVFPLDPNDKDDISGHPMLWDEGGKGFYCGSCHDPHVQPEATGDYLRTKTGSDIGDPNHRTAFCKQCHYTSSDNSHLLLNDCEACHHPHKGIIMAQDGPEDKVGEINEVARKIFNADIISAASFEAKPNVPLINDPANPFISTSPIEIDPNFLSSSYFCYGCHQPRHLSGADSWIESGAAPIYGDGYSVEYEHHPMGTKALSSGKHFKNIPGITVYFNPSRELTCVSCHINHITEATESDDKENNFLRFDFAQDNAEFCISCHSDKNMGADQPLEVFEDSKHFWKNSSPLTRYVYDDNPSVDPPYTKKIASRQCMFCHFIHDGENRGNIENPQLDTLMRVPAKVLETGERQRTDPVYYEDLCYGCHGRSSIVGGHGNDGALLTFLNTEGPVFPEDYYFTHRFASTPDPQKPPYTNMTKPGSPFPISDGPDNDVIIDDYGTEEGQFFCGSCHNVHAQYDPNSPYLNSGKSPYIPYGFCEACHDENEGFGAFVDNSHPIDKNPNNDPKFGKPTGEEFIDYYNKSAERNVLFVKGGSGESGGITSPRNNRDTRGKVICLTCHNTHSAQTSWSGGARTDPGGDKHGQLLVKDNYREHHIISPGSELCKACHPFVETPEGEYQFPSVVHGGSNLAGAEFGICNACHTPHGAMGPKLWSKVGYNSGPFEGSRQMCFTCHNGSEAFVGLETVFKGAEPGGDIAEAYREDHVMWNWAYIQDGKVAGYDFDHFPIDYTDTDSIPLCAVPRAENEGFYCGSCHNVHIQPPGGKGDFLRSKDGNVESIADFCNNCHQGVHGQDTGSCQTCHQVHSGAVQVCVNSIEGRWILLNRVQSKAFVAYPNVDAFEDNLYVDDPNYTDAPFCYGCHGPDAWQDWAAAGARPIYGDDATDPNEQKEHHPMGAQALRTNPRAEEPGDPNQRYYNSNGELTCKSCHDGIHANGYFSTDRDKARENYFLRWELNNGSDRDKTAFCLECHPNKVGLKNNQDNKHCWTVADDSPNNRGGCMFCHFIHNGEARQSRGDGIQGIRADVDALMLVPAVILQWGDRVADTDVFDYEDMCYGCHSNTSIVKGREDIGSLLQPGTYFTHRFAVIPDPNSATSENVIPGGVYPLSDGPGTATLNDYGTETGHMFCGSCHNVHDGTVTPYLNYAPGDINLSVRNGFCEECHESTSGDFVAMSHPVYVGPNPPATTAQWDSIFYDGGSGKPFGITGEGSAPAETGPEGTVVCITCHNIHAASTDWKGGANGDLDSGKHGKLLVEDNFSDNQGSDMCRDCHPF